jgi:hypothetical protein
MNAQPAFPSQWIDTQPTTGEQCVREQYPGMTLRDYFAAAALQAYALEFQERMAAADIASQCYSLADAMLIHRNADKWGKE